MGYIAHHAIIVTCWKKDDIDEAHKMARVLFGSMVTDIIKGVANDYYTFFVGPDGSKERWDTSEDYNQRRTEYIAALSKKNLYVDCVVVRYGGDDPDFAKIEAIQGYKEAA